MSKNLLIALVLIVLCAIILILNRGKTSVDLLITDISAAKSFIYLGFIAVGVTIGVLIK